MKRISAVGTRILSLGSAGLAGLLLVIGQIRFSALSLAVTFAAMALARAQGVLPATFRVRRARTDVLVTLVIAVALAALALALPLGR